MDSTTESNYPLGGEIQLDEQGELLLSGHSASGLIARFGSPLVVLLEEVIRRNCREYRRHLESYPRSRVYYAGKAFLTTGFCRLLEQEGLGLDVVSAGELHTALCAKFPPADILLHGNAKGEGELKRAIEAGVGRIAIDNFAEIEVLERLTSELDKTIKVLLRLAPGVRPETHEYVQTGQVDSKFGFNMAGGAAEEAVRRVLAVPALELVGLHCHIGSQILDLAPFEVAAKAMMEFYARMKNTLGAPLDELNLGGGLGIRYQAGDNPPSIAEHLERLCRTVLDAAREQKVEPPVLIDEPGRSIVGEAGVTLYTVQGVKRIPGVRNYASVDGGMTDNPRYALYQARHPVLLANRAGEQADDEPWSISGKCCETGDMLIHDAMLPALQPGDLIAMFCTGAYTYSMASNYNRVPRPAVVLVGPGRASLLARRETPEDVARLDQIPDWLEHLP